MSREQGKGGEGSMLTRVIAVLAATLAVLAGAIGWIAWDMRAASDDPRPSPSASVQTVDADGFPDVDWDAWERRNPDVVGWISIPGTEVGYPVLQASASDPDYYLHHDWRGRWSAWGSICLDAGCADGMDSANLVVFGHHMRDGTMFARIAGYADASWAGAHSTVLLQTKEWKRVFEVDGSDIAPGWNAAKRTVFEDLGDMRAYREERLDGCEVVLGHAEISDVEQMCTLVTCSYTTWADERTLIYASR